MSTETVTDGASGSSASASGEGQTSSASDTNTVNSAQNSEPETYPPSFVKKVMTEKKNQGERLKSVEAELEAFKAKEKERTENSLKEQNQWKEYATLKETEAKEAREKLQTHEQNLDSAEKFNALLDAIPGNVKKDYWPLLQNHLSKVIKNPDTGEIDEVSVKQVADMVRNSYPEIIQNGNGRNLPQDAAQPNQFFDKSQWDAMSPEDKKKNLPEYVKQKLNN